VLGAAPPEPAAWRVTVDAIVDDDAFGRFGLQANQLPPLNLFVARDALAARLELDDRANVLLVDAPDGDAVDAAVAAAFSPEDAQLELALGASEVELRSDRIFIDPVVRDAVRTAGPPLTGILTYFVNAIEHGDRSTPYSMVTAIGGLDGAAAAWDGSVPTDLAADEIVVNAWLAEDLACGPGDTLVLRYYVLDEEDRLVETSSSFVVRAVVPQRGIAGDRTLMPPFPGIADAEASRDWEPGIPIDLGRIRAKDEAYWEAHRGTPKAFIALDAGRTRWGNRYGDLTAIRFPAAHADAVRAALRDDLDPATLGFFARDVRGPALAASRSTTDFGGLFLGLSFFLIAAALLLIVLVFVFNTERRAREMGTLLAVGFPVALVRRLLLVEGLLLAIVGAVLGAAVGVGYTRIVLAALAGVWRRAVASATIELFVVPTTLAVGAVATVVAATIAMRLALGRITRCEPVMLLAGETQPPAARDGRPVIARVAVAGCVIAAIALVATVGTDDRTAAPAFFGAGALMLVAAVAAGRLLLGRLRRPGIRPRTTLPGLALGNAARRPGRSLTTGALIASGVFLVLAVAVNQLDALRDADARSSGTGGFAFVASTTMRVHVDLDRERGRDAFGLTADDMAGVSVVSMRVRDGDDASCLNLNLAQRPRLLGVDPGSLATREAFRFVRALDPATLERGWRMLDDPARDGAIPAIADDTSATWAMHRSIGDTIEYVDDQGRPFEVVLVGTVANSVLQGSVIIAEDRFRARFPSEDGFRSFLIDAPPNERARVAPRLRGALADVGLEVTAASTRLAEFSAVQNTYLSIFRMLGGLGLLLGTVGLGIVVVRNVMERAGELAVLRAVGFGPGRIRRLVLAEHLFVLIVGVAGGVVAAFVALWPVLRSPTSVMPVRFTVAILAALLANGFIWVWLATRIAVASRTIETLEEEGR
jgi:hypothetical protein